MKTRLRRLWLGLPFALCCAADAAFTLAGQSAAYWAGHRDQPNEVFPLFASALEAGPPAFLLLCLLWLAVLGALIVLLPRLPAEVLALALTCGHAWGIMTWLVYRFEVNYYLCLLGLLPVSLVYVLCHRRWRAGSRSPTGG